MKINKIKKAYLVKLTDADDDVCAFLIDEETANSPNMCNDFAVKLPWTDKVLDGDNDSYTRDYAKTKDILEIIKNAEKMVILLI
jgi:hypothetical protein